jgi:DNA polymerase I-like protein with 3'-5' exonuclease and polymerase domains
MTLYHGIILPGHPDLENIRKLDLLPVPMIMSMVRYGFAIDRDALSDISSTLRAQMSDLRDDICTYIPEDRLEEFMERSNLDDDLPMNVDSNVQLAHLLFDVLKVGSGTDLKRTNRTSGCRKSVKL